MKVGMDVHPARRRTARIRCVQDCIKCFQVCKSLPASVCFVPSVLEYTSLQKTTLKLMTEPQKNSKKFKEFVCTPESRLLASGEDYCNCYGKWLKIYKIQTSLQSPAEVLESGAWLLLHSYRSSTEEAPSVVPLPSLKPILSNWEAVVENQYLLQLPGRKAQEVPPNEEAVARLQHVPEGWNLEHDAAVVHLMAQQLPPVNDQLGNIKSYVESIDVSSSDEDDSAWNLTDGDPKTFWESDGNQGQHWIRLRMKKGTIIKKLAITVDGSDDNFLPSRVVVQGGEQDNLKTLNDVDVEGVPSDEAMDVTLLENMTEHYPNIIIRIKECKAQGIDCRVRGIKLVSSEERFLGFDVDFFSGENITRFPILEPFSAEQLYRRSIVIQRFSSLLDSVLPYIVPSWQYSVGSYNCLEAIRQLLPLSKKRMSLIDTYLRTTATVSPEKPAVYINRRAAMEHRCDPALDPEAKNSVFMQLYEGLKPRERGGKPLDYRWGVSFDQWWECKFLSEGIIDQGGGFRDSLSDLSEELCPSSPDAPLPLPFFIRTPNQLINEGSASDTFIPNPSCRDFDKFEWIGQLMGACFRGRENLVLSLPAFVWKKLVGETVSWERDFQSVDAAEVRLVDSMQSMDEATFAATGRNWSLTQSNSSVVVVRVDTEGNPQELQYEDRAEYAAEVRRLRMQECDEQLQAMRRGLLKVLPQAVLDLLTWQELEARVCGDPEISIEALKKCTHYDDLEERDIRVKYFWEAMKNFSNEDRSRFLRFVTGRRRLPAPLYISSGKGDVIDSLPESSTCSNMLFLPYYTSSKVAEEKIRYASYNCVAIDTDMNPWED